MRHAPPRPGPAPQPSLLETVPGLQDQLMNLPPVTGGNDTATLIQTSSAPVASVDSLSTSTVRTDLPASISNLEVFADAPVRSLRGGDLGMYFSPHDSRDVETLSQTIAPVEGEVIDGDIAYRGGFPVVTTSASAPPKEICFLCGSAGVDVSLPSSVCSSIIPYSSSPSLF